MQKDTTFVCLEVWDEDGKYALSANLNTKNQYYMPSFEIFSSTITDLEAAMDPATIAEIPEVWDNDKFLIDVLYETCKLYVKYGRTLPNDEFTPKEAREYSKNLYDITETIPHSDLPRVCDVFEKFFTTCEQFGVTADKMENKLMNDSDSEN